MTCTRKTWVLLGAVGVLGVTGLIIIIILLSNASNKSESNTYYHQVSLPTGAVISNGEPCADYGMRILREYGNVVDSTIATMLCDGVTTLNMGLGGGFVATIYLKDQREAYSLNARGTAPSLTGSDVYRLKSRVSKSGGTSITVPGELKGYREMYKRFGGKAPWALLFEYPIELCQTGVRINRDTAEIIAKEEMNIRLSRTLYDLLKRPDGKLAMEGDIIRQPRLGRTLSTIAYEPDVLYSGYLAEVLVDDILDDGGVMTVQDLNRYSVRWDEPTIVSLQHNSLTMFSTPEPSSGSILGFILKVLDGQLNTREDAVEDKNDKDFKLNSTDSGDDGDEDKQIPNLEDTFKITEVFKYAYGYRAKLGDPLFHHLSQIKSKLESRELREMIRRKLNRNFTSEKEEEYGPGVPIDDHGTGNIIVYAPNGDVIVATSSINFPFGSKLVSKKTGIILNNGMDEFSALEISPFSNNFIVPGARPLSSMCPAVFVDSQTGDVKLALSAGGGPKMISSSAIVALRTLWYNISLEKAILMPRFHHQLFPMEWYFESRTNQTIVKGMEARGHKVKVYNGSESYVTAVSKADIGIKAFADCRKVGTISYIGY